MKFDPFVARAETTPTNRYTGEPGNAPAARTFITTPEAMQKTPSIPRTALAAQSGWEARKPIDYMRDCFYFGRDGAKPENELGLLILEFLPVIGPIVALGKVVEDVENEDDFPTILIDALGAVPFGKIASLLKIGRVTKLYKGAKFLKKTKLSSWVFKGALYTEEITGVKATKWIVQSAKRSGKRFHAEALEKAIKKAFVESESVSLIECTRELLDTMSDVATGVTLLVPYLARIQLDLDIVTMSVFLAALDVPFPELRWQRKRRPMSDTLHKEMDELLYAEASADSLGWIQDRPGLPHLGWVRRAHVEPLLRGRAAKEQCPDDAICLALANITSAIFDMWDCLALNEDPRQEVFTGGTRPAEMLDVIADVLAGKYVRYIVDLSSIPATLPASMLTNPIT